MTTIEEAAYHEAGHVYYARRRVGTRVEYMRVYEGEQGWDGEADIPDYDDPKKPILLGWAVIALAGPTAEAMRDALSRYDDDNEGLVSTPDLETSLVEYVERAEELASERTPEAERKKALQLTFRTKSGNEAVCSISVNDVSRIPPLCRDRASILGALQSAMDSINDETEWRVIDALAQGVIKAENLRLEQEDIEKIIDDNA